MSVKASKLSSNFSAKIVLISLSITGIFAAAIMPLSAADPPTQREKIKVDSSTLLAQNIQRIKFKPGASSADIKGAVPRGSVSIYSIGANEGQTMSVEIQSVEGNAVFKVIDPNTNALAEGQKSWSGKLPQSGDYQIVVGTERGGASYTLSVEIQ